MSLLDHPEAQAIMADTVVTPNASEGQSNRPTSFLQRLLVRSYRPEQRATAPPVIRGRDTWAALQPGSQCERITLCDGEK